MDRCRDHEVFLQYLFVVIPANVNGSESDKLLVNERERVSECQEAVVSDSELHNADVVSELRLVGEIDDEPEACSIGVIR